MENNKEATKVNSEKTTNETEKNVEPSASEERRSQPSRNRGRTRRPGSRRRHGRRRPKKQYEERVVNINRVAKTVKGGRRIRFVAVVVVGNKKGSYGFAHAKAIEVPDAIRKSFESAKKDIQQVELTGSADTISHEVVGRFGASKVFLKPAPEGTGIIAGGPVRVLLELAGIRNVYSKIYGSRNPLNVLRATHDGLQNLKSRKDVQALREYEG